MPAVAALLDSRAALGALRRSLPKGSAPVVACRSGSGLTRVLGTRLLEVVVLGPSTARGMDLSSLRTRYPAIPVVAYGVFRSEDAELLLAWHRLPVAAVLVEGVDDPVAGEVVMRHSVSARRRAALRDAPQLLRLTEPLQRATWECLVRSGGRPPRTARIAKEMGLSREHLSRQFGAGGAPNLKRVADLLSVLAALSLLANPAYGINHVARLLKFSTPSHLRAMVRRITNLGLPEAQKLGEREVLGRFLRSGARSRR
jgi:AraC-like DNA-binding protein